MNATINNRQLDILRLLTRNSKGISTDEILTGLGEKQSRYTIIRDLNMLSKQNYVEIIGRARATKYVVTINALKHQAVFRPDDYTSMPVDDRYIGYTDPLSVLGNNFLDPEYKKLLGLKKIYVTVSKMSETAQKKLWERFVIDLSWKSSAMEGNTYSILETERLIRDGIKGDGKTDFETKMILNHKNAFDFVVKNQPEFANKLSFAVVEHVHKLLAEGLGIPSGYRKIPVGISGSLYKPTAIPYVFKEQMGRLIKVVNDEPEALSRALSMVAGISYIQPFEDGNKRTSRIVANGVLMSLGYPPLSYRAIDELTYKKAVVTYYEQANIYHLKEIFKEQLIFSKNAYFS